MRVMVLRERYSRLPHDLAVLGVEGLQPAVDDRRDDQAFVQRQSTVHDAATDLRAHAISIHLRIRSPFARAGARVDGNDDAPVRDAVDDAIPDERRRFLPAASEAELEGPHGTRPSPDVASVDVCEGAEARLGLVQAVGQPLLADAALRRAASSMGPACCAMSADAVATAAARPAAHADAGLRPVETGEPRDARRDFMRGSLPKSQAMGDGPWAIALAATAGDRCC